MRHGEERGTWGAGRPGDVAIREVERRGEKWMRRRKVRDIRGVVECVEVDYSWVGEEEVIDSQPELDGEEREKGERG